MERLWRTRDPQSVREVLEDLERDRPIAYTTVMTVLDNLHRKGFVRRQKDGRAYLYVATLSREEHTSGLLEEVLAQSADRGATLMHFVGAMSPHELEDLRAALARLEDAGDDA